MQKRVLTTAILGFMGVTSSQLMAQITLSNSIFPAAKVTLPTSTMLDVSAYTLTPSSAVAQTWDFSQLYTDNFREDIMADASAGGAFAQFPTADVIQDLIPGLGGAAYVDVTNDEVNIIGGGIDLLGFAIVEPFSDPHKLQIAPLNLGTAYNDDFAFSFGEHIDSIPFLRQLIDSLAGGMLPGGIEPDSIRLSIAGDRATRVDAFGSLTSPEGTFDVLRQRVVEHTTIAIEVHVDPGFFPAFWFDVTSMLTGALPVAIPTDTTLWHYDYWAEGYKQPIVRMNMDPSGTTLQNIEFRGQNVNPNSVNNIEAQEPLRFYPNPASTELTLEMGNYAQQNCQVQVVAADGKIWSELNANHVPALQIPVATLPQGVYALVVRDTKGNLLKTAKAVINR